MLVLICDIIIQKVLKFAKQVFAKIEYLIINLCV